MPHGVGMSTTVMAPSTSSVRGLPSSPAQGIRRFGTSLGDIPPPPPIPDKFNYHASQTSSMLSVSGPISAGQVINLAREAMKSALRDTQSQAAEVSGVSTQLKPGVTIDLSRRNIQELPDGVVDIIKNELERLAVSHNKLTSFPPRFSECTSLRYLNVRNNLIKEFPLSLCELKSLEILDLGRNKIKILPPEIVKLVSLKVLAVQKNRIEELPLCLAEMSTLQVLKLEGNNIKFPAREVMQVLAGSPRNQGYLKESEVTEIELTAHVKRFLKQRLLEEAEKSAEDHGGDDNSDGVDTPRVYAKRTVSGRFPVRVNGVESTDMRWPSMPRPPPIPSRSHARGLSQQNTARRPGVLPLTIGNPNERLRSNSETLVQARGDRTAERPTDRGRRMGIMSKKASDLGTLDETQANNRFSHYRGLSHGSSMNGNHQPAVATGAGPANAIDPLLQRPNYVRRLSVLPEQRRESRVYDPIIECAKGILYSIFQIHPMVQLVTRLTNDGSAKRSSLEIVFYNTNVHVEELEQEILKHESSCRDSHAGRENQNVQRAVMTLINAYSHICSILTSNMDRIIDNGDPRYLRTLMVLLYNSIMELRVTANEASIYLPQNSPAASHAAAAHAAPATPLWTPAMAGSESGRTESSDGGDTIKPFALRSPTPRAERPNTGSIPGSVAGVAGSTSSASSLAGRARNGYAMHNPSNLRVSTDVSLPYINGSGRTAVITSATPRSGESFASASTDGRYVTDVADEERTFEKIFLALSKATEIIMRTLPNFSTQFNVGWRNARAQRTSEQGLNCWRSLNSQCSNSIQQAELMKGRLSMIKLKEPGVRTDAVFWGLCKSFIDAWAEFGNILKYSMQYIPLPLDIRAQLRPVQMAIKDTTRLIMASPWAYRFRHAGHHSEGSNYFLPGHYSNNSAASQPQLPMTPQSAALGPAVQATVPSTPQAFSFSGAFVGDVFERADALISMGGLSMTRNGTMHNTTSMSLGTIPAITSADGRYGASSMLSPSPGDFGGAMSYRRQGGGKS